MVEPLTLPKLALMVVVPPTAKDVEPLTAPEVAVIVVLPTLTPTASPSLTTVATFVAEEFQAAEVVMF